MKTKYFNTKRHNVEFEIEDIIKQKFFRFLKSGEIEKKFNKIEKIDLNKSHLAVICPNLKNGTFKNIKEIMQIYFESCEQKIQKQANIKENIFLFSENALRYNYSITEKKVLEFCKKLNATIKKNKGTTTHLLFCIEQKNEERYNNMAYLLDGENIYFNSKKFFTKYDYKRLQKYAKRTKQNILISQWGENYFEKTKNKKTNFLEFYVPENKTKIEYRICADAAILNKKEVGDKKILLLSANNLSLNIQLKLFSNLDFYEQIIINDGKEGSYKLKMEMDCYPTINGPNQKILLGIQNNNIILDIFFI
ncbi:MAG: hypothetical protein QXH71_03165 [Candidatus Anstonellaceae archaeon]